VHELEGGNRCDYHWPVPPHFPECAYCDNKATYQARLLGERSRVIAAFDRAGTLWLATPTPT
jgi:hypothetical protein